MYPPSPPLLARLACLLIVLIVLATVWSCSDDSPSSPEEPTPTPPPTASIQISSPARGGMVQSGSHDDSPITVEGTACDSLSTLASLTIGGQSVPLTGSPPCLDFTTSTTSRWGLNIVAGTARNTAGATTPFASSYLRSPTYFLPETTQRSIKSDAQSAAEAEKIPSAYYLHLDQSIIDDGSRADVDDFTTIANLAVGTISLAGAITNPLIQVGGTRITCDCLFPIPDINVLSTGYRVTAGTITGGQSSVQYTNLTDTGFAMRVRVAAISLPVAVNGYLNPTCPVACATGIVPNETATGTVSAPAFTFDPTIVVTLDPNGHPQVSVTVDASGFVPSIDIDWGLLEFLDGPIGLSSITTAIIGEVEVLLEQRVETMLAQKIAEIMMEFLVSFEPPATMTLAAPMNTILNVTSEFDVIDFAATEYLRLGFAVAVSPATPVIASPLGSIRRDGNAPTFDAIDGALGIGIKDDLINQVLWAAWRGGAFDNMAPIAGCGAGDLLMALTPPPVMMPGAGNYVIEFGLGDAYVDASGPNGDISLFASSIVGGMIGFELPSDRLFAGWEPDPAVAFQVVSASASADLDQLAAQYGPVITCTLSQHVHRVIQSIPMPIPSIGQIGVPGVPGTMRWGFDDGVVVTRQASYYTITGDMIVK